MVQTTFSPITDSSGLGMCIISLRLSKSGAKKYTSLSARYSLPLCEWVSIAIFSGYPASGILYYVKAVKRVASRHFEFALNPGGPFLRGTSRKTVGFNIESRQLLELHAELHLEFKCIIPMVSEKRLVEAYSHSLIDTGKRHHTYGSRTVVGNLLDREKILGDI